MARHRGRPLTGRARPWALVGVLGTVGAVSACAGADAGVELRSDVEHEAVAVQDSVGVPDAVDATTALGAALVMAGEPGENHVVSPASVAVALAMLAEGARGESAAVLDAALGAAGDERTDAYNALQAAVLEYDGDPGDVDDDDLPERPLLHVANGVVVDEGREIEPGYLDSLARGYGAGVRVAELADSSGGRVLDAWVREHTGGRIESSSIRPDPDLVLVLQNAVLLAARWQDPFGAELTAQRPFTLASGEEVTVDAMSQQVLAAYADVAGGQAVRLPYSEAFAMDVFLPGPGRQAALGVEQWRALDEGLGGPAATDVQLQLPKVDVETSIDLVPPLTQLGMGILFADPGADLTGIAPDLVVGAVGHQTALTVDEEGTVAAATTEIGAEAGYAPAPSDPVVMTVDRPFALRIVHVETGWPLFMGVVADPRG